MYVIGGKRTRLEPRQCLSCSESGEDRVLGDPREWFRRLGRKGMVGYLATVRPGGAIDARSRDRPAPPLAELF